MWRKPHHGISIPIRQECNVEKYVYVKNAMSRNMFEFMWRNIHFSDNSKIKHKGVRGYDPLFKVIYPFQIMMKGMIFVWTAGKHVTIDKIMIKYIGIAITYVQYMPAKPINHGIKVFFICCALSTIFLGFKVTLARRIILITQLWEFVMIW